MLGTAARSRADGKACDWISVGEWPMMPTSSDPDFAEHAETYRGFVRWVSIVVGTAGAVLLILAVWLL